MRLWLIGLLLFGTSLMCSAAVISGRLENGTSGGDGQAERVQLIRLGQGMEVVATQDDVLGSFLLNFDGEIDQNFLVQAIKGGVTYTQRLVNPDETVRVMVYDANAEAQVDVRVSSMAFYAEGDHIEVGLFYLLNNVSEPPQTRTGSPSFVFPAMQNYLNMDVSSQRGTMPLRQTVPVDDAGLAQLSYALKPGETQLNVRYRFPYDPSGENAFQIPLPGPQSFLHVLALPMTMTVDGENLAFVEEDEGRQFKVFSWQPTEASDMVSVTVTGEPAEAGAAAAIAESSEAEAQQARAAGERDIEQVSHPINRYVWPITIGMFLLICGLAYAGTLMRTA